MTRDVQIATRIPRDLAAEVDKLAEAMGRNRAWIAYQAIQAYVASEREFIEAVKQGLDDYQAGRVVPHAEIVAGLERRRERREQLQAQA